MSFQSFVTQSLAAINSTLNAIANNAKKIEELPAQTTLDPSSKMQVSRGGTSESLEVQKIIDAVAASNYDKILAMGAITIVGNDVKFPAGGEWLIENVHYGNIAEISRNVPFSSTGKNRIVIAVANTLNDIVIESGEESAGIAVRPNIPIGTVLVTQINVYDSSFGTPTEPIIGDSFVKKMESQDLIIDSGSPVLNEAALIDERSSILLTGAITDLKSIQVSPDLIRPGKPIFIKNKTGHDVTLWYLDGTGNVQFFFSNEIDMIFKTGEIVQFNLNTNDSGDIRAEYVGVISITDLSNYYTKDETDAADAANLAVAKAYADSLVVGLLDLRGVYDASSNLFPTTGGSGTSGAVLKGDFWYVSVAGTLAGKAVVAGDSFMALTDTPGQTAGNWNVIETNIGYVPENVSNKTGTIIGNESSTTLYVHIAGLIAYFQQKLTDSIFGAFINSLTTKTTPIDADYDIIMDSADSNKAKKVSFVNRKATLKTYFDTLYQTALTSGTNIKTVNGTTLLGSGNLNTPDMDTTSPQNVTGVKTFKNLMLGLRNVADTFTSFVTNAATASRTWTFPDKSGTVAMTSDLPTNTIATGTQNVIPKYNNSGGTQLGNSRLKDDGIYLGIGSFSPLALTKDIQLGRDANKEIGIEQSESTSPGRDLTITAGRTINFAETSSFVRYANTMLLNWRGIVRAVNGNFYASTAYSGDIYKQTGGTGNFVALGQTARHWMALAAAPNGDIYSMAQNGDIYKQTGGTGNFVALSQTSRNWQCITAAPNGNIYATVDNGDIYKQTGGTGNFVALGQSTRAWRGISANSSGDIYAVVAGGDIYKQTAGTGNFIALGQTSRNWQSIVITNSNDIYAGTSGNDVYKQTGSTGSFLALSQTALNWWQLTSDLNNSVYAATGDNNYIYYLDNYGLGLPNLDGGTQKIKSGSGKGTGKSRVEIYTGQKTVSGTDMQTDTLRAYFDENGFLVYLTPPTYANDAAADADSNLPSKAFYQITGNRAIYQKP